MLNWPSGLVALPTGNEISSPLVVKSGQGTLTLVQWPSGLIHVCIVAPCLCVQVTIKYWCIGRAALYILLHCACMSLSIGALAERPCIFCCNVGKHSLIIGALAERPCMFCCIAVWQLSFYLQLSFPPPSGVTSAGALHCSFSSFSLAARAGPIGKMSVTYTPSSGLCQSRL